MKNLIHTNLTPLWALLCSLVPFIGISQSDCAQDNKSPFCMVKSYSINGIDSIGGAEIFFPRIAYDACSEVKIIDYYLVREERKVEPGEFLACGEHLMQTFVIDSSGNYSVCEFTLEIKCNNRTEVKSSVKEKVKKQSESYKIGKLSKTWESGNQGPGTISNTPGDPGGKSYGIYQISSRQDYLSDFLNNEGIKFHSFFHGLPIASKDFDSAWKSVAAVYPKEFAELQHNFIERTHYEIFIERIDPKLKFEIENYSPVLQDVLWSTVVQHGPYSNIFNYALAGMNTEVISEESIINLIYEERGKQEQGQLIYFPSVSSAWKKGLINRFDEERVEALKQLKTYKY
ncbi:MAG: hypothetical protein HKN68_12710 [Saprospiraceae bacterium]|nr:hypothetical protein [Saprospiraceae bacterium]